MVEDKQVFDITSWLKEHRLSDLEELFEEHDIDTLPVLLSLTDDDMKDSLHLPLGLRKKLRMAVKHTVKLLYEVSYTNDRHSQDVVVEQAPKTTPIADNSTKKPEVSIKDETPMTESPSKNSTRVLSSRVADESDTAPTIENIRGGVDIGEFPMGKLYYKQVAIDGSRFMSIFDKYTEYRLDTTLNDPVKKGRKGGYYVYDNYQHAMKADIATNAPRFQQPRAMAVCLCWGHCVRYGHKLAFDYIRPVAFVAMSRFTQLHAMATANQVPRTQVSDQVPREKRVGYEPDLLYCGKCYHHPAHCECHRAPKPRKPLRRESKQPQEPEPREEPKPAPKEEPKSEEPYRPGPVLSVALLTPRSGRDMSTVPPTPAHIWGGNQEWEVRLAMDRNAQGAPTLRPMLPTDTNGINDSNNSGNVPVSMTCSLM